MKSLQNIITKTNTGAALAFIFVLLFFGVLFTLLLCNIRAAEVTETQIVQGLMSALSLILGYFFGASRQKEKAETNEQ